MPAAYLIPEGPALLTEHGKRVIDQRGLLVDKHWPELWDICELAKSEEHAKWADIQRALEESGVPTMNHERYRSGDDGEDH